MKVYHLRDIIRDNTPFGTIAIADDGNIGVAICRDNEPFNKKRGREIAIGRALKKPFDEVVMLNQLPDRNVWNYDGQYVTLKTFIKDKIDYLVGVPVEYEDPHPYMVI